MLIHQDHIAIGIGDHETRRSAFAALLLPLAAPAHAVAVDFDNWTYDGAALWNVSPTGQRVEQAWSSTNPSTFFSPWLAQGRSFSGTVRVTENDDDFIGFTLGYRSDDANMDSPLNDFLLIEW